MAGFWKSSPHLMFLWNFKIVTVEICNHGTSSYSEDEKNSGNYSLLSTRKWRRCISPKNVIGHAMLTKTLPF